MILLVMDTISIFIIACIILLFCIILVYLYFKGIDTFLKPLPDWVKFFFKPRNQYHCNINKDKLILSLKNAVDIIRANYIDIIENKITELKPNDIIVNYPFYIDVLRTMQYLHYNRICINRNDIHNALYSLYGTNLRRSHDLHVSIDNGREKVDRFILLDIENAMNYYLQNKYDIDTIISV